MTTLCERKDTEKVKLFEKSVKKKTIPLCLSLSLYIYHSLIFGSVWIVLQSAKKLLTVTATFYLVSYVLPVATIWSTTRIGVDMSMHITSEPNSGRQTGKWKFRYFLHTIGIS